MIRFYIVRHGETDWNRQRRAMGRRAIPLNGKGLRDIELVAETLSCKAIEAIYASPLKRTMETAEIIGRKTGARIVEDERLIEIGMGPWEGRFFDDLLKDEAYREFLLNPGGHHPEGVERMSEVQRRGVKLIREIVENHRSGSFVLVSHADVIRPILCYYLHIPLQYMRSFSIDTASISILDVSENGGKVSLLNYLTGGIP